MKNILFILSIVMATISFSQNFKKETTLNGDGTITEKIIVSQEALTNYLSLKAVVSGNDTLYYFIYRDYTYTQIVSFQTTKYYTKDEVVKILDMMQKVKDKVVDNASYSPIRITRYGMGSIKFHGEVGFGYVNLPNLTKNFKSFIN
jgi:hypothetical protein